MCKCTPEVRTPYCGKGQCVWPGSKPEGARSNIPQDVEEFIDEHELVSSSGSEVNSLIRASDLRAWMTGHVRVPVEPTEAMIVAFTDPFIAVNGDNRSASHQAYKAMLNASKGE